MSSTLHQLGACALPLVALSCGKVPFSEVDAGFVVADAAWFAEEETLFVFYEVTAEQGLGEPSVVEVTYTTDDERVPWTPMSELPTVHTHVPVDCGSHAMCGSISVHVPLEPRDLDIRLRYHHDSEMSLDAGTVFNVVAAGPAHTNRSLVVYGVFDELNQRVQWRSRHQFPTVRNEDAEALGLRRTFLVQEQRFGTEKLASASNPYGYGVECPSSFVLTGFVDLETTERAAFSPEVMPLGASDASTVCADATVTDATGTFTTGAIARKNPEVRAAFPILNSPIEDATQVPFFLGPCDRTISVEHDEMLRQRLLIEDVPTTCTDDWDQPGFVDGLVVAFRDAVEAERAAGSDMVLTVALSQDETGVSEAVEEALAQVVPAERHRNTPRLAGAFVLDSTIRGLSLPELAPVTLWCPSTLPDDELPDASTRTCAIAPDNPELDLGPFSFGALPILPSRDQYLDFIETHSVQQAGWVEALSFGAPEFATTSDHVDVGDFGVATFLNNEFISADPGDAFSYCIGDEPELIVFRSDLLIELVPSAEDCEEYGLSPEDCPTVLTLDLLPEWHNEFGESSYELGVFWEFPFLLQMDYQLVQAGSLNAFGFTVPFGSASPAESYYGTEIWTEDEFDLSDNLTQCTRFCGHPTFDSAGVYQVTDPFRTSYANVCYHPDYPAPGDSGFPLDP